MNTDSNTSTIARFYRCALQVNPYEYVKYRGEKQKPTKEQYYQQLVSICLERDIKVIGLADHGSIDAWDDVIEHFNSEDIVVFPGFELTSSEKIHFVCLFDESCTKTRLDRLLGRLDVLDPNERVRPSSLSAVQLIDKVDELGGLIYAAHCTNDNGVLKQRLDNVWTHEKLRAAQIPGDVESLRGVANDFYRKVLLNKDPNYARERRLAYINAADVVNPSDLCNDNTSCLIKMSVPCFSSFKVAFLDPGSRVRLNSDVEENYSSSIQGVEFTNGYLDGVNLQFSENLNTVIGGRGTGKSTLLEGIRFAMDQSPLGTQAKEMHTQIIKANLAAEKGAVSVRVQSSALGGRSFTVFRKYGDAPVVIDEHGNTVTYTPKELLPELELYGQNEIHELIRDKNHRNKLINRFLKDQPNDLVVQLKELREKLVTNREKLIATRTRQTDLQDDIDKLPKLQDQIRQFISLGIAENLDSIPFLEREKSINKRHSSFLDEFEAILEIKTKNTPRLDMLDDDEIGSLPHGNLLRTQFELLTQFREEWYEVTDKLALLLSDARQSFKTLQEQLEKLILQEEEKLEESFRQIPANRGKTGRQIGIEYQQLLQEKSRIEPRKDEGEALSSEIKSLYTERRQILYELSELKAKKTNSLQKAVNRLNRKLSGKVRIQLHVEGNREELFQFLLSRKMPSIGSSRLNWVRDQDFSAQNLADTIRSGEDAIKNANWGGTSVANQELSKLSEHDLLCLEEIDLPDVIELELNTLHDESASPRFRCIDDLSTGQQCTAVLHLLLLENNDPLILDQPEDNLDNAFIADRIVAELRKMKLTRQFIFATHNANIPVFGDAEWIGVVSLDDAKGQIKKSHQGSIDLPEIQRLAANILEGGKSAFNQRREKYGFD